MATERRDDGHRWVGAALITVPGAVVKQAHRRGIFHLRRDTKVAVTEVYCSECRLGFDQAVPGQRCSALEDKNGKGHLVGGGARPAPATRAAEPMLPRAI